MLLTLRWRVSWWTLPSNGKASADIGKECFEDSVNALCRVFYFYYCNMRRKIPTYSNLKDMRAGYSRQLKTDAPAFDHFRGIG